MNKTILGISALLAIVMGRPSVALAETLPADLGVAKTTAGSVVAGENLTYTVTVTSNGPGAATNVTLSDALPAGTTFVSATQTAGPAFNLTTPAVGQNGTVTASSAAFATAAVNSPQLITSANGLVFFVATDADHGIELWRSDGTGAGTMMLKDISPGSASSSPDGLVNVNGTLFFRATDDSHGEELWKSDGTVAGTVMVKDIFPGSGSALSISASVATVGNTLFFAATDGTHGYELWKSDGSEAGTVMVKDARAGNNGNSPYFMTTAGSIVYYSAADDDAHGAELWRSDGSEAGTYMLKDINRGAGSSYPQNFANVGGTLYFEADDGVHGFELWKSTGTSAGTVLVKDIFPGSESGYSVGFKGIGNTAYFLAIDATHGAEMWKTDGTTAGTVLVKDVNPGSNSSDTGAFTPIGNTLYFTATTPGFGNELWKTDGTEAGTVMIKDIVPGVDYSYPQALIAVGDTLYFRATDPAHNQELWKSDGTEAGTVLVKDIFPGNGDSNPNYVGRAPGASVGNTLYFDATDGVHGLELWKTDGTEAGTLPVRSAVLASFDIVVSVAPLASGTLSNTASVVSDNDSDASNDAASVSTTVLDAPRPTVVIDSPVVNQKILLPNFNGNSIRGTVTYHLGVKAVKLRLSRKRNNVNQYWNGSDFVIASSVVDATLQGNEAVTWSLGAKLPPVSKLDTGLYQVEAYATDVVGNKSPSVIRPFTLYLDSTAPTVTIGSPVANQKVLIANFTGDIIRGGATDDFVIGSVKVRLSRKRGTANQYWNGSDFVSASSYVDATYTGNNSGTWSLSSKLPSADKLDSGLYQVDVYATDAAGNKSATVTRPFTLGTDFTAPSVSISTPKSNQKIDASAFGAGTITGVAEDNIGVTSVKVKLQRKRGTVTTYWNGTEFTATAATVEATLSGTTWSLDTPVPAAQLDAGAYTVYASAYDAAGNSVTSASRAFIVAVSAAPVSGGGS